MKGRILEIIVLKQVQGSFMDRISALKSVKRLLFFVITSAVVLLSLINRAEGVRGPVSSRNVTLLGHMDIEGGGKSVV